MRVLLRFLGFFELDSALVLVILLSSASAFAMPTPGDTGPADPAVSESTGAANFRIPIDVPPGQGGFAPKLALAYSSRVGDGLYGVGWALGLGSPGEIRCAVRFGVPDYANCPRFELDGELLTRNSDITNETRFHTFVESFQRIRALPHGQANPSFWEVTLPDGTVLIFGDSDNSRVYQDQGPAIARWLLAEMRDPFGPAIRFAYTDNPAVPTGGLGPDVGTLYPSNIHYADGTRQVHFKWEARPDPIHDFSGGIERQISRRLLEIEVESNGRVFSRRVLRYNEGLHYTTGRSRLTGTQLYGAGCTQEDPEVLPNPCPGLPPQEFDYTDVPTAGGAGVQWVEMPGYRVPLAGNIHVGEPPQHMADIDGDGRVDRLVAGLDQQLVPTVEVLLNTGTGFEKHAGWTAAFEGLTKQVPRIEVRQVEGQDPADAWGVYGFAAGVCEFLSIQLVEKPIAEQFPLSHRPGVRFTTWANNGQSLFESDLEVSGHWTLTDLDSDGLADLVMSVRQNGVHVSLDCANGSPVSPIHHPGVHTAMVYRNTGSGWELDAGLASGLPPFGEVNVEGGHYIERHAGVPYTDEEINDPTIMDPLGTPDNACWARGLPGLWPSDGYEYASGLCYNQIALDPRFVDLNGDGYTDLLVLEREDPLNPWVGLTDSLKTARNLARTRAFLQRPGETPRWVPAPEFDLPIDAPGMPPAMGFAHSWADYTINLGNLGCSVIGGGINNPGLLSCAPGSYRRIGGMQLVDLNRDGLVDAVWSIFSHAFGGQPAAPIAQGVLLNMGQGTGSGRAWCAADASTGAYVGGTCAFAAQYLPPSDGVGFAWTSGRFKPQRSGFVGDFNGDGWVDYLKHDIHHTSSTQTFLQDPGAPNPWLADPRFDLPMTLQDWNNANAYWNQFGQNSGFAVLDVNGDGVSDVVGDTKALVSVYAHADLVATMRNGKGGTLELRYEAALRQQDAALEAQASAHADEPEIAESLGSVLKDVVRWTPSPVVVSVTVSGPNIESEPGSAGVVTEYRYAHPRFCLDSRSDLGFRLVERTRPDDSVVLDYYYQQHGRAGKTSRVSVHDAGVLLHLYEEKWELPTHDVPGSFGHPDVHVGRLQEVYSANQYAPGPGSEWTRTFSYAASSGVEHGYNFVTEVRETRPTSSLLTLRQPEPIDIQRHLVHRVQRVARLNAAFELLAYQKLSYTDQNNVATFDKPALREVWDGARDGSGTGRWLQTHQSFDAHGNVIQEEAPDGRVRNFCYDDGIGTSHCPAGHGSHSILVGSQDPAVGGNPGKWRTFTPHETLSQPVRIESEYADEPTLDRAYDAWGRAESEWRTPHGQNPDSHRVLSQRIEWTDATLPSPPYRETWAFVDPNASESDALKSVVVTDGFGGIWKSIQRNPNGGYAGTLIWSAPASRRARTTLPVFCGSDPTCSGIAGDTQAPAQETLSDALGRPIRLDTPNGFASFHYRHVNRIQPAGSGVFTDFDAVLSKNGKGDLTERILDGDRVVWADECGNSVTPATSLGSVHSCTGRVSTFYTYQAVGELDTIYDPLQLYSDPNHYIRYHYDTLGRVIRIQDADLTGPGDTRTAYNLAGNVASTLNARREQRSYEYDELDRLIEVNAPGNEEDVSIDYRADERNRWKETSSYYTREYTYDALGRLAREELGVEHLSSLWWHFLTDREYDLQGQITRITHPDSTILQYEYVRGHLDRICELGASATDCQSASAEPFVEEVRYDDLGRREVIRSRHGDRSFEYDAQHRLRKDLYSSAGGSYTYSREYAEYDEVGNLKQVLGLSSKSDIELDATYHYDQYNRISSFRPGSAPTQAFGYDALGNLQFHAGELQYYSDPERPHAIQARGTHTAYGYDEDGNVTSIIGSKRARHFQFDSANRLVCFGPHAGSCKNRIRYDVNGRRILDTDAVNYEAYVGLEFTYTRTLFTLQSRVEVMGFGKRIAFKVDPRPILRRAAPWTPPAASGPGGVGIDPVRRWELSDPLGSGLVIVDENGERLTHRVFAPFGRVHDWAGFANTKTYYAGHLYDEKKGLHYMQARWYDPASGRFLSVDPLVDMTRPETHNPYTYAANNPLAIVDPSGTTGIPVTCVENVICGSAPNGPLMRTSELVRRNADGSTEVIAKGNFGREALVAVRAHASLVAAMGRLSNVLSNDLSALVDTQFERTLSENANSHPHANPFILEASLDVGLGAGVVASVPGIEGEAEVFFGNSAIVGLDGPRSEMAARAIVRVSVAGFETTLGFEHVETDRLAPSPGIDDRFSAAVRNGGLSFFNPFTNGFQSNAEIPTKLRLRARGALGLGASVGAGIDLEP